MKEQRSEFWFRILKDLAEEERHYWIYIKNKNIDEWLMEEYGVCCKNATEK